MSLPQRTTGAGRASSIPMPEDEESSSLEDLSIDYIIKNKPKAKEVREYFKARVDMLG